MSRQPSYFFSAFCFKAFAYSDAERYWSIKPLARDDRKTITMS
jgi:hypothetical protein